MRRALILVALAPLLMAQGLPRPLCGFGEGLSHLREVERDTAQPVTGVTQGRARSERMLAGLTSAFSTFRECGCPRLAELTAGKLVISVLAGKKIASLARIFPHARNLVRTMPNTPGQIGAGITGWCVRDPLTSADCATVETILGALGQSVEVDEPQMDALTGVSGSGPAYVFEFAAALRDAGVAAGLAPATARKLAVETLLGAARLLARKNIEPETLRNQVTSPNGTTFAGLQRMAAGDFRGLIRETVLAAKARSEELSKDS